MQGFNVLIVFSNDISKILMCRRKKNPYKGLHNFPGGKIEQNESGIDAAYRELHEETGILPQDIRLHHLMDFTYYLQNCYVEAYVGKLVRDLSVRGDENELFWSDLSHDFFDMNLFAGEGNIGHMLEQIKMHQGILFSE